MKDEVLTVCVLTTGDQMVMLDHAPLTVTHQCLTNALPRANLLLSTRIATLYMCVCVCACVCM